jgi:hypothetical protein
MGFDWTEFNYHGDSRVVNARAQREFNEGFNMEAMTFTFTQENDDGEEVSYTLPAKFEVCPTCEGRGSHVNPSIDAGGISEDDDFWHDDEDEEGNSRYRSGFYNVTCYTCGGRNVVPAIARERADEATLKIWDAKSEDDADFEAVCRAERMMGA